MKKIFTLIAGLFMAVAVMAAGHKPDVTIRNSRNFKIVIDGRAFYSNGPFLRINNLSRGYHRLEVFEMRRGHFGQRERLVNSTSFRMGKDDVRIIIDHAGRIDIMRERDNRWDRSWDRDGRYDQRNDRPYERNDRPYERNDRPYERSDDDHRRY